MINAKIPRIIEEKIVDDRVFQIISFFENDKEKFDVVYFNKSDVENMAKEIVSSKKRIETFEDKEKAIEFLEKQR